MKSHFSKKQAKREAPGNEGKRRAHEGILRADALMQEGELERAREVLDAMLEGDPDSEPVHGRLAAIYLRQSDWAGLRVEWERSLKNRSPEVAEYDRGYLNLLFGEMPEGWDRYEVRLRIPGKVSPKRHFSQPRWNGEPFPGKTLLLHFEQGFGDTVMFVRFARRVKALGGRVVLAAQKPLVDLLATCPGLDAVVADGESLPPFDLHLPLPSLPQVFRTTLESIPCDIPYLDVPPNVPNRQGIAGLLARSEGRTRIGCSWAGNPNHGRDKERSIPRKTFGKLGAIPDVAWYSFQFGAMENAPLPGLTPLSPMLHNFSDTAYALSGMDLVITVDTALAHLAGAMGIPTLLLVHFQPDYRWMLERQDSPWYPTLRIFRQPSPGDWESVLNDVIQALTADS